MPTTDRDIALFVEISYRLREETYGCGTWDRAGIHAVISKFKNHSFVETLDRVVGHSLDPKAQTPGAMQRPFIPTPAVTTPERRQPVKAGQDCRLHVGEHAHACRLCAVDHIAHPEDPGHSTDTEAGRALLEEIRNRRTTPSGGDPA